jgi:peptide/nickel transport system permease protein
MRPEAGFLGSLLAESARRRGVRWALGMLALLYASAVYAPLLANGRPYLLEAIDLAGFAAARRSLMPVAHALGERVAEEPELWLARRIAGSTATQAEAALAEANALAARVGLLRAHLATPCAALESCARELETVRAAVRAGRLEEAREPASSAVAAAAVALAELDTIDLADPAAVREHLRATRTFPLFASLSPLEVFWMTAFPLLAVAAWRRSRSRVAVESLRVGTSGDGSRVRAREERSGDCTPSSWPRALALSLAVSLAAALAWRVAVGEGAGIAGANVRQAILRGELLVERAWFAPIAFGFAETSLPESYAPPGPALGSADESSPAGAPRVRHWLGTDSLGRDLLARLLWGGRTSLTVGLSAALLLALLGTAIGLAAGYFGGTIDLVISRVIEIVSAFPTFLLVLLVAAASDPKTMPPLAGVTLVIALVGWTGVARLARAEALRLREADFVVAARALGLTDARTIARHVLPNALGPVIVAATFAVGAGVLIESALSFLGFGISAPVPSWGSLINESRHAEHWWIHLFPGLAIFATVVSYNLVGEGLRDALDPRSREPAR